VLAGAIRVTGRDGHGNDTPIVEHGEASSPARVSCAGRRSSTAARSANSKRC
jgi:hypothetical protein